MLSKAEINKMINSLNNLKHRLVISLLYSSGLRVSELINLKNSDMNYVDNTIHIKNAKGGKDRITILSKKVKAQLKKYGRGENYVFESKGKKYSTLLKGEKPDKIMPELSGKTSKKIKKLIG